MKLKSILSHIASIWVKRNSKSYINYLRKKGVQIGNNCIFRHPNTIRIDVSRPSLVTIGNNVDMNMNFQILTHDWSSLVFRSAFNDFVNSSGRVTIGSNIYFGTNVIVLKGVTIGDNCIIGAGSVVTKNIPSNSVAAGSPCKVICSLKDYYNKRKKIALDEAVDYVKSIQERWGRTPNLHEMREEFIYFVDNKNYKNYKDIPIKFQLNEAFDYYMKNHTPIFNSFEEFISYANSRS